MRPRNFSQALKAGLADWASLARATLSASNLVPVKNPPRKITTSKETANRVLMFTAPIQGQLI